MNSFLISSLYLYVNAWVSCVILGCENNGIRNLISLATCKWILSLFPSCILMSALGYQYVKIMTFAHLAFWGSPTFCGHFIQLRNPQKCVTSENSLLKVTGAPTPSWFNSYHIRLNWLKLLPWCCCIYSLYGYFPGGCFLIVSRDGEHLSRIIHHRYHFTFCLG